MVINNNVLVDVQDEVQELSNGINVESKSASRRKIVHGSVIESSMEQISKGDVVYFPLYSSDEISVDGISYYIVNGLDIKFIKRGD